MRKIREGESAGEPWAVRALGGVGGRHELARSTAPQPPASAELLRLRHDTERLASASSLLLPRVWVGVRGRRFALVEGGDLAGDEAQALVRGLLELHAIPGDEFPWDPSLGDAFNAREGELERRVGTAAAGWLSAGRPRREAFRVGLRLTARAAAT